MSDPAARDAVGAALGHYDIEARSVTPVRLINNAVFRVGTADGDIAVRIHRPGYRTASETRSELQFLEAIGAETDVAVPRPRRTTAGHLVARVDGAVPFHASVFEWVDGEVRRPGQGAGEATISGLGRVLATMHRFSETFAPPAGFDLPSLDVRSLLDRPVPSDSLRRLVDEIGRVASERLSEIDRTPEAHGPIHHDFVLGNILHVGRTPHVIDFDDCGVGHHLQDLGGILENLSDGPRPAPMREAFVAGYTSVRPWPAADEVDERIMIGLRHATAALFLLDREDALGDRFGRAMEHRMVSLGSLLAALS